MQHPKKGGGKNRSPARYLKRIAQDLNKTRERNSDLLPIDVFPSALNIAGSYPCVEIIVRGKDKKGNVVYFLKKRTANEQGWRNLYHVIGTVIRKHDTQEQIWKRLSAELSLALQFPERRLVFFSPALRYEIPRKATSLATVYILDVTEKESKRFDEHWKAFTESEIPKAAIIDFHKTLLLRVTKKNKGFLPYDKGFRATTKISKPK